MPVYGIESVSLWFLSLYLSMRSGCRIQLLKYSSCHERRLRVYLNFSHEAELSKKSIKFFMISEVKKPNDWKSISKSATSTCDLLDHLFELN